MLRRIDVARVRVGQTVRIRAVEGESLGEARIARIAPAAAAGTQALRVWAKPGNGAQLVAGRFVNADVLDALGPKGFLVNIGRGSVVDTDALAAALRSGRIAGAGLDVYESEPKRPEQLIDIDNLVITPHLAGWSPEATEASFNRFLANADGHFSGRGVVTPI